MAPKNILLCMLCLIQTALASPSVIPAPLLELQKKIESKATASTAQGLIDDYRKTLKSIEGELNTQTPQSKDYDSLAVYQLVEWAERGVPKVLSKNACKSAIANFHRVVDPKSTNLSNATEPAKFTFKLLQSACKKI
jgi:uncharacterized iron-regulated protein